MNTRFEKLKALLRELFQLDQPELDFGIYRIMQARAAEITQFLEHDLLPQVKQAFAQYQSADRASVEQELQRAIEQAQALGVDPESTQKVRELRARLESETVDVATLEADVYDHLYRFFRRYYHEGDFISRRVYKEGVYAIPYEGEEVKLYWANHDQYYIKTSEYLRDYAFRLQPQSDRNPMRVHFRLVDAAEDEHDNVKPASGKERVFILAPGDFIAEEDGELVIRFEYRPATPADWPDDQREGKNKPPKQKDLLEAAEQRILAVEKSALERWIQELAKPHVKSDGSQADYSRLRAHLNRYTARNTFDYFIHKDLGTFLRRELDFYIKNEVMHLDDVEHESAPRVEQYLSKIRVIRRIAQKIIEFLEQLENFQKRLWLKKKFVVETSWCVSIGTILGIEDEPTRQALLEQIAANDAQRAEWVRLHAINELKPGRGNLFEEGTPGYSEPLSAAFLQAHPSLMIDTRHFSPGFTARLLASLQNLDELTDGVLVHSENFQALSLMQARHKRRVAVVFADPPYNTGVDGFPYKDIYQHSSWLTMMENRLSLAQGILSPTGLLFLTIDFVEVSRLRLLCDCVFGDDNFLADIAWEKRYTRSNNAKRFYSLKDTVLCYRASTSLDIIREARSEKSKSNYSNPDNDPRGPWISSSYVNPATKEQRPNLVYPIRNPFTGQDVEHPTHAWKYDLATHEIHVADNRLYWGVDGSYELPRLKSFLSEASEGMVPIDVWHYKLTGTTDDGGNVVKALFGSAAFENPKPPTLVERALSLSPEGNDRTSVLDHFAGSGTTGHAVINLNREDDGRRKFILVEMADFFDTVLLPRLKKVTFTPEWKDGKPKRMATPEECERGPRVFKVIRLESYEDTLNNLELRRSPEVRSLLDQPEVRGPDGLREQYVLRYMLEVESRGSASLLNIEWFCDPLLYRLRVKRPGSDESRSMCVDLVETFNWLIGLRVDHMGVPQVLTARFQRDGEGRLRLEGRLRQVGDDPYAETPGSSEKRWWFRTITGTLPDGRKALVIWRNRPGGEEPEGVEQDNLVLDEWFTKQGYSSQDSEFDLIYVNGTNNLENLRLPDATWKVRLIEEDFHRLMFATEGV